MTRLTRRAVVAMLVGIAACNGDEPFIPPPTDATVVGAYNLSIVNGGTLPFPYSATATFRLDIISGRITLRADHSFDDELVFRKTFTGGESDPDQTSTLSGTWALSGTAITLTFAGQAPQQAAVSADLLTRNDQGLVLTYRK